MGKAKAQAREEAIANGIEYMSEEEEVPTITMAMLNFALSESTKSVSEASYKKYLDMKEIFERESGRPMGVAAPVATGSSGASAPVNQQLDLGGDDDDDDD